MAEGDPPARPNLREPVAVTTAGAACANVHTLVVFLSAASSVLRRELAHKGTRPEGQEAAGRPLTTFFGLW